jgi:hypothetical protein
MINMLKKILKPQYSQEDGVFPVQKPIVVEKNNITSGGANVALDTKTVTQLSRELIDSEAFMREVAKLITPDIIEKLAKQYNFEPTEKYVQEALDKKKYISQLDDYLQERKQINKTVENDLQQFLQDTTNSLSKALESFSTNINSRIRDAENRYGIDAIKESLLSNDENK